MNALISNLPKKRMIAGIFLFWVFVFGTFEIKQFANEKNYSHCIRSYALVHYSTAIRKSGYHYLPVGLSDNYSEQPVPLGAKEVKILSKRYHIPRKKVEAIVANVSKYFKKPQVPIIYKLDKEIFLKDNYSRRLSALRHSTSQVQILEPIEPIKLTFNQKISRVGETTIESIVGGYFKIMGISFTRKSCKEKAR